MLPVHDHVVGLTDSQRQRQVPIPFLLLSRASNILPLLLVSKVKFDSWPPDGFGVKGYPGGMSYHANRG